jgi:serine/threonine protein phosphatase PrpC
MVCERLVAARGHLCYVASQDSFLLLACDGLWDVLGHQEAVDHTHAVLQSGASASDAAQRLADLALRLGSSDNVTVIVVTLSHEGSSAPTSVEAGRPSSC